MAYGTADALERHEGRRAPSTSVLESPTPRERLRAGLMLLGLLALAAAFWAAVIFFFVAMT